MKYESQTRATVEYERRNYDKVILKVPKGKKELIRAAADAAGVSMNRFVLSCVEHETGLALTLDNALPWAQECAGKSE